MKVSGGHPSKNLWLMKVSGGHPFGLMLIPKKKAQNTHLLWFKWPKNLVHSFYDILYQPKGCPPLGTTSLVQAV